MMFQFLTGFEKLLGFLFCPYMNQDGMQLMLTIRAGYLDRKYYPNLL